MKLTLRNATLAAIIGTSYFFVLRLFATIFLDFFGSLTAARVTSILALPAMAATLFFFISFYNDFLERKQGKLGKITRLVIIYYIAMMLLVIRRMLFVFDINFLPSLTRSHYYAPVIQWLGSLVILLFFVLFYRETVSAKLLKLHTAAISAIVGSTIGAIIQTIVLLNYHSTQSAHRFFFVPRDVMILLLPIAAIAFATMLYFFITFYRVGITQER